MRNKIILNEEMLEVHCDRNDAETQHILSQMYPVHANRIKTVFPMSASMAPRVLAELRGITEDSLDTAPESVQRIVGNIIGRERAIADLIANGPKESPVVNSHLTLDRHQQLGREIAKHAKKYGFFYDTRTGKCPMSLTIIHDDIVANPTHKWLVVCPLILIETSWLEDANKFFPNDMRVISCHASTKKKRLEKLKLPANVYITNTESFVNYMDYFEEMHFAGVVLDESSDMKSHRSNVSKALVEFALTVDRMYLLSGTPAPNGKHEYYMQMRAIDYYCMPPSYTQFKEHFFNNMSREPTYDKLVIKPEMDEVLMDIVRKRALFVDMTDAVTTPGREFHEVILTLPVELKKHYDKMRNDLCVELEQDKKITSPSAAAKRNKLNQITSGFIIDTATVKDNKLYKEHNKEWYLLNNYRFDALMDLLNGPECVGQQAIIWANYHAEFEVIQQLLGNRCRCIYGKTSNDENLETIRLFKSKQIQYLVANPASADKGLTLTNAHIAVYFSLNDSYELFKQSMERIYGSTRIQPLFCHYYILIAEKTIDRILYSEVLCGKQNASYAFLKHLKEGRFLDNA